MFYKLKSYFFCNLHFFKESDKVKRINLSSEYEKSRSYSSAVVSEGGRTIWLAGHFATEETTGKSLIGDFDGQVRSVFHKLSVTLAQVDASLSDIVSMTCFITDVTNNIRFVEIRKEFFQNDKFPASALVTVSALNRPEMLIEIQAVAVSKS